jgi:Spy/CpxP family protein refolding chaperone
MRTFGKLALALGMVALIAAPARAQGRGGFGMFGGGAMLLSNKGVQKEIKATDEQASKLDALADEMRQKGRDNFEKVRDLGDDERRAKMQEFARAQQEELKKGLADILKPEQIKRFDQIQIQAAGVGAFAMPRVQEVLKLTDDQKAKIREINEETMQTTREAFQSAGDDREAAMKKITEIRKQAFDKAANVLTDAQKKDWKDLTGDPYEVKFEFRRPNN